MVKAGYTRRRHRLEGIQTGALRFYFPTMDGWAFMSGRLGGGRGGFQPLSIVQGEERIDVRSFATIIQRYRSVVGLMLHVHPWGAWVSHCCDRLTYMSCRGELNAVNRMMCAQSSDSKLQVFLWVGNERKSPAPTTVIGSNRLPGMSARAPLGQSPLPAAATPALLIKRPRPLPPWQAHPQTSTPATASVI